MNSYVLLFNEIRSRLISFSHEDVSTAFGHLKPGKFDGSPLFSNRVSLMPPQPLFLPYPYFFLLLSAILFCLGVELCLQAYPQTV